MELPNFETINRISEFITKILLMKKILYPTDFSTHSIDVLHYALELAKKFEATLIVAHAFGKPEFFSNGTPKPINKAGEMLEVLTNFVDSHKAKKYQAVEIEHIVEVGFPPETILDIVEEEGISLVVMGMASKDDIAKKFFGSVAREVLKRVDCPILLIPTNFRYKKPTKIVYTTNFLFKDISALSALEKWASIFNAKIHCLHVTEFEEEMAAARANMDILEAGFSNTRIADFEVIKGQLVTDTDTYLVKENIEMVAMLSRKRNLLQRIVEGSNAQQMAKQTSVPLLVLKGDVFAPTKWETVVDEVEVPLWERD